MGRSTAILFSAAVLISSGVGAGLVDSPFVRGDSNRDGQVDISDPLAMLNYLFLGDVQVDEYCLAASDANGDGAVDLSDPVYTLCFLFCGGPLPPAPYPQAGQDPNPKGLGCVGWELGTLSE